MTPTVSRRIKTQLKTWFAAVGIPATVDQFLHVRNNKGEDVRIELVGPGGPGIVLVDGTNFTSRNLQKGLDAFQRLQQELGYEPKAPLDRGPVPQRKAHYSNDFELVAMRHADFRRVPNPPPGKLESYRVVIDKSIWKFFRTNQVRCQDNLLSIDDLRSYAQVWTCEYIGMHEVPNVAQTENERFLFHFLAQRFGEFRKLIDKKNRNVLPMLDEAFIAAHGRPYEYTTKGDWYAADPEEAVNEWEIANEDDQPIGELAAPMSATTPLDVQLESMGHEKMVFALRDVVENDRIHLDARREASKRLQTHALACDDCSKVEMPRAHGDDAIVSAIMDETGTTYANTREAAKALKVYPSNVRAVLSGRYKTTGGHTFKYVSAASAEA